MRDDLTEEYNILLMAIKEIADYSDECPINVARITAQKAADKVLKIRHNKNHRI